jgi:hypothetical protein
MGWLRRALLTWGDAQVVDWLQPNQSRTIRLVLQYKKVVIQHGSI